MELFPILVSNLSRNISPFSNKNKNYWKNISSLSDKNKSCWRNIFQKNNCVGFFFQETQKCYFMLKNNP